MKKIEYQCDFCGNELGTGTARPMAAVNLVRVGNWELRNRDFEDAEPEDATWHLCHQCLAGLVVLAQRKLTRGNVVEAGS